MNNEAENKLAQAVYEAIRQYMVETDGKYIPSIDPEYTDTTMTHQTGRSYSIVNVSVTKTVIGSAY